MKRICRVLSIFVSLMMITFGGTHVLAERPDASPYLIGFHDTVDIALIERYGGKIKRQYKYMPVVAAELSPQAAEELSKNPKIEYVEDDGYVYIIEQVIPWGVAKIKAPEVHTSARGVTGKGIKVGVIDTGIDSTHEDLQVSGGATFVEGTEDFMDDNGHGTHIAGIISALDNSVGVVGVAPQASLYAIKAVNKNGTGQVSDLVAAIEWAITNNMNIINMSLGVDSDHTTLRRAVDTAFSSGMLIVAAAGNRGFNSEGTIEYPAKYGSVIAVGAVDRQNNRAGFSSVGPELEIMAPGVDILSTVPGNYMTRSGTSMAAPHVTGEAALIWEASSNLTNAQVRETLNQTAQRLGDSFSFGNGIADALNAINFIGR
ncbi:S8 family peptidase [Paenibacillus alkalitolerans]|uniref:S8 family peptidase n=1 Tax=Paenibacillus alkalitolerans TaxID=2799335 RepID=UPI0018F51732|nr:S8 family peptidase [Paenibacillus alkalitolerans]